jgi:predicted dehydrogenase
MSQERLRWGIVSTANIGRTSVIPAIQQSSNGEVVAVASRGTDRAADFAAELDIPRAYGSYADLLADDDLDAVYIPLPNSLHHEWTIRSAEAGKHILCEKPLALNGAECLEMASAASSNGVKLMEAFMYRFHPQVDLTLELLKQGVIGAPKMIYAAFTFRLTDPDNIRWEPELGGGALMDVGCYCVNVSRTLAGAEPVEVQATAEWADTGVDAQLMGTLRFAGGLVAQIACAMTLKRREVVQIAGPDGFIDVPHTFIPGTEDATIVEHHGGDEPIVHTAPGVDEYQLMVEHFADCVLHDLPVRYPPTEAAANMRVIDALYRSAHNGGRPEAVAA